MNRSLGTGGAQYVEVLKRRPCGPRVEDLPEITGGPFVATEHVIGRRPVDGPRGSPERTTVIAQFSRRRETRYGGSLVTIGSAFTEEIRMAEYASSL